MPPPLGTVVRLRTVLLCARMASQRAHRIANHVGRSLSGTCLPPGLTSSKFTNRREGRRHTTYHQALGRPTMCANGQKEQGRSECCPNGSKNPAFFESRRLVQVQWKGQSTHSRRSTSLSTTSKTSVVALVLVNSNGKALIQVGARHLQLAYVHATLHALHGASLFNTPHRPLL